MKLILAIIINIVLLKGCSTLKQNRIIGGKSVHIKDYSYQLAIVLKPTNGGAKTEFKGGAVIVSKDWGITAAHCIKFISDNLFSAGMVFLRGNTSSWKSTSDSNDHKIILKQVHPKYDETTNDYDLALLKVDKPFKGRYEKPIKIASNRYKLPKNALVNVSGWGMTTNEGDGPENHLRAVTVKIVDFDACKDIYAYATEASFSLRMVCAWDDGKDACIYDSGGPLVRNNVLIGVVSWGMRCASSVYPGVYSRIAAFYSWIQNYDKKQKGSLGISFAR